MNSNPFSNGNPAGMDLAAALRALPHRSAPAGGWKRVLEGHAAGRRAERNRRRYWGGGLALAAGLAAAVIGVRMGGGEFSGLPVDEGAGLSPGDPAVAAGLLSSEDVSAYFGASPVMELTQMDMESLIALSQFQEDRLRALPVAASSRPGRVLEVDAFGLVTEIEDQIALLDEGLMPASLNSGDQYRRSLLQERAWLMDELFSLRRAEAAQAGYIHADF